MITTAVSRNRALRRLVQHARPLETAVSFPADAIGQVAAHDIRAESNVPEQPCSVRDGYAVHSSDIEKASPMSPVRLPVTHVVLAESVNPPPVLRDKAARVLTGGLVPPGCDAVLAEEDVERDGDEIVITNPVRPGWFIRAAGGEIPFGGDILSAGEVVTPQAAAVMVRTRVESLTIHPKPTARILSLGSELCDPCGDDDGCGRFPADNLVVAAGLIAQGGGVVLETGVLPDNRESLVSVLQGELPRILVTTGGTGKSERDFARIGAREAGFEVLFENVDIRPGRNAFAAVRDDTLLFGLPGPPAAVFACFHALILPVLRSMEGLPVSDTPLRAVFEEGISAKPGGEWLVQCRLERRGSTLYARPLAGKEHPPMQAMGQAHGVAVLQGGDSVLPGGEVDVLCCPFV